MSLVGLSAAEMRRRVAARQVSCDELVRAHLDRLTEVEPRIGALLLPLADRALEKARSQDSGRSSHQL